MNRILSLFVGALMLVSFCAVSVYASDKTLLTLESPIVSGITGTFVGVSVRASDDASWYFSIGTGRFNTSDASKLDARFAKEVKVELFWFEPGIEIPVGCANHCRLLLAAMIGAVSWEDSCCGGSKDARGYKVGFAFGDEALSMAINHRRVGTSQFGLVGITSIALRFGFK